MFKAKMESFQNNGVSKIQQAIAKAINFQDILEQAKGSAILRLNSQRLEQLDEQGINKPAIVPAPASIQASPPPTDAKRSAATAYANEQRVFHVQLQAPSSATGTMTTATATAAASTVTNSSSSTEQSTTTSISTQGAIAAAQGAASDDIVLTSRSEGFHVPVSAVKTRRHTELAKKPPPVKNTNVAKATGAATGGVQLKLKGNVGASKNENRDGNTAVAPLAASSSHLPAVVK